MTGLGAGSAAGREGVRQGQSEGAREGHHAGGPPGRLAISGRGRGRMNEERVRLTDLDELVVGEEELLEVLRDAEEDAWFRCEPNGDGTWTVYTGLARGAQWPQVGR